MIAYDLGFHELNDRMLNAQAQLWAQKHAVVSRPPSDTASATADGSAGEAADGDDRERIDATALGDLLSEVRTRRLSKVQ